MSEQRQDLRELLKRNSKLTKENQALKLEIKNLIDKLSRYQLNLTELP